MEKFRVDRRILSASAPHDWIPDAAWVGEVLDWHVLTDGVPFVLEEDGTDRGCSSLNRYVLEAVRLDALKVSSLGRSHVYHLFRFLRFLRDRRNGVADLIQAVEVDLIAYKRSRQPSLSDSSWDNEVSSISGFYHWAQRAGLIERSPIPRWDSYKSADPNVGFECGRPCNPTPGTPPISKSRTVDYGAGVSGKPFHCSRSCAWGPDVRRNSPSCCYG